MSNKLPHYSTSANSFHTKENWKKQFDEKVRELNDLSLAIHQKFHNSTTSTVTWDEGEAIAEFGYKLFRGREIFTVPDWGNVKKFISKIVKEVKQEERDWYREELEMLLKHIASFRDFHSDREYILDRMENVINQVKNRIQV